VIDVFSSAGYNCVRLQAGIMVIEATRVERQWRNIDCIASKMKQQKRRLNKQTIINNHKLIQIFSPPQDF